MEEDSIISPSTHGSDSSVQIEQAVTEARTADRQPPFRRHSSFEGSVATGAKFRQQANLGDFLQEALDVDELVIEDEDEGFSESVHDIYLAAFQKLAVDEAAFRRHSVGYEGGPNRTDDVETQISLVQEENIARRNSLNSTQPEDLSAANTAAALKRSMTKARSMTKPTMFKAHKMGEQSLDESMNSDSANSIGTEVSGDGIVKDEVTKTTTSSWNYRNRVLFYVFLIMVGVVLAAISFFLTKFVEPNTLNKIKII